MNLPQRPLLISELIAPVRFLELRGDVTVGDLTGPKILGANRFWFLRHLIKLCYSAVFVTCFALFECFTWASASDTYKIVCSRPSSATAEIKAEVEGILDQMPTTLLRNLTLDGLKIVVVPSVAEYLNFGYNDRPRGWTRGGGYDGTDGLFHPSKNELLVAERVSVYNGAPRKSTRLDYVVKHELGHAYDYYLGRKKNSYSITSVASRLAKNYEYEVSRLTNTQRNSLEYFCQADSNAGKSEIFAELFSMQFTPREKWREDQRSLDSLFPKTKELVLDCLKNPESVERWMAECD